MSWLLSFLTILSLWLMGNKSIWGPIVGLVACIPWTIFTFVTKQWGLIPGNIAVAIVNARNLYLWTKNK